MTPLLNNIQGPYINNIPNHKKHSYNRKKGNPTSLLTKSKHAGRNMKTIQIH